MINEFPERRTSKGDHLEADLEQQDLWYGEWHYDDLEEFTVTHSYQLWRQTVRNRGFRFHNILSNKDSRVVTVVFRRP